MKWLARETTALAREACAKCHGLGILAVRNNQAQPCNCVLRSIFRACYARFRYCATKEKPFSKAAPEFMPGKHRKLSWGRKDEEYAADFCLVSRRTLDDPEYQLFKFHFLLGADWRLCCQRLRMDRGTFFHAVYRIEHKLGRVFRELEPYSLFPLDEYFHGTVRWAPPCGRSGRRGKPPAEFGPGFHMIGQRSA